MEPFATPIDKWPNHLICFMLFEYPALKRPCEGGSASLMGEPPASARPPYHLMFENSYFLLLLQHEYTTYFIKVENEKQ